MVYFFSEDLCIEKSLPASARSVGIRLKKVVIGEE
jgi:hypothetical protein